MKTQLILVRHGQSQGNLNRSFLGYTDLDITDLGRRQADLVRGALHGIPLHAVYSSDLIRAVHTALPTAIDHNLEVQPLEALREIYAGEWENRHFSDLIAMYPHSYAELWLHHTGAAHPDGGESVAHLQERIVGAVEKIAKENEGHRVMIVSHGTPIRVLAATVMGYGLEGMENCIWVPNASITQIEYENGKFHMIQYGSAEHLGDAVTRLPGTV